MLYHRSLPTIAAVLAIATAASAQVGTLYTFAQTAGTYTPISGGTLLGTTTGTSGATSLDDNTYSVALPFTFPYDGGGHTQVQIQTNGHLCFGTLNTTTYTPISGTTVTPGYVSAFASDLQGGYAFTSTRTLGSDQVTAISAIGPVQIGDTLVGTGIPVGATVLAITAGVITMSALATATSAGTLTTAMGANYELRCGTLGSTPNQEFVVQWKNFKRWNATESLYVNFQIRLKENGEINCVYGDCSPGTSTNTGTFQVGLRGPTNAFPANVNNRKNTKGVNDNWNASVAGTANNSGMLFNNVAPANVIPSGLTYTWTPPVGVVATNTTLGVGCGAAPNSFYQLFATSTPASAALSGNSLQLIPNGFGGYNGAWLPGTAAALFVPPVLPAVLPTSDDGTAPFALTTPFPTPQGPQLSLLVSGNAIVAWNGAVMDYPGTSSWVPTAAGFLNSTLGGVYAWHDYNQAEVGSGPILSEEIGTVAYVTFNGVESYASPEVVNPSTLQFQFDKTTGIITIVFVSVDGNPSSGFGSGHLIGVTSPGLSQDPGSVNLATALLSTTNPEILPLTLTASNTPKQMAVPNNWNLVVSNVPPTPLIGIDIFGLSDPNILDLSLFGLGKTGCQLRASLDVMNAWFSAGTTHNYLLTIPISPNLNNFVLYTQSVALGATFPDNITTNGIRGLIGNL